MCNVCGALLLMRGETLTVRSKKSKNVYEIRGSAKEAELGSCTYSLRKNNGEWKEFNSSETLAGIVGHGVRNVCTGR